MNALTDPGNWTQEAAACTHVLLLSPSLSLRRANDELEVAAPRGVVAHTRREQFVATGNATSGTASLFPALCPWSGKVSFPGFRPDPIVQLLSPRAGARIERFLYSTMIVQTKYSYEETWIERILLKKDRRKVRSTRDSERERDLAFLNRIEKNSHTREINDALRPISRFFFGSPSTCAATRVLLVYARDTRTHT